MKSAAAAGDHPVPSARRRTASGSHGGAPSDRRVLNAPMMVSASMPHPRMATWGVVPWTDGGTPPEGE